VKIRNPRLLKAAGWLTTRGVKGLVRTLRTEYRPAGPVLAPVTAIEPPLRVAYALWHENLIMPSVFFGHPDIAVLISKHADGQLLGSLIENMGMGMVLGSTNRGGVEAVRQIVTGKAGRKHLVVTPDGPRGPRRVVQAGIIYVASRTGMPVIPVGVGYQRPWRAKSWDRFAIPRPGSRAKMITGKPIMVPAGLKSDQLEPYRLLVQHDMEKLTIAAENWAETNRYEAPQLV
jgi:lysophospholipid acyltransferase (LPLAT)-like uncharacterized protein